MRLRVVCRFVTFRYCDHIGWNTSTIISRLISLRLERSDATGTPPKLGWNRSGVMSAKTCNISETVRDRTNRLAIGYYDGLESQRFVQSRDVSPHNFDGLAMSSSAFSVAPRNSTCCLGLLNIVGVQCALRRTA